MATLPKFIITSFKEDTIRKVLKSEYDGGYVQKRPQYTRAKKKFYVGYAALKVAEAEILEDFIMNNQGLSFEFTHPLNNKIYEVTYDSDSISFNYITSQYRNTELVLSEV